MKQAVAFSSRTVTSLPSVPIARLKKITGISPAASIISCAVSGAPEVTMLTINKLLQPAIAVLIWSICFAWSFAANWLSYAIPAASNSAFNASRTELK